MPPSQWALVLKTLQVMRVVDWIWSLTNLLLTVGYGQGPLAHPQMITLTQRCIGEDACRWLSSDSSSLTVEPKTLDVSRASSEAPRWWQRPPALDRLALAHPTTSSSLCFDAHPIRRHLARTANYAHPRTTRREMWFCCCDTSWRDRRPTLPCPLFPH